MNPNVIMAAIDVHTISQDSLCFEINWKPLADEELTNVKNMLGMHGEEKSN